MWLHEPQHHPLVIENQDRIAWMRGPRLSSLEGVDHPDRDLRLLKVSPASDRDPEYVPELLKGVVVLRGTARYCATNDGGDSLYRSQRSDHAAHRNPYYAWANREPSPMLVWLRYDRDQDE